MDLRRLLYPRQVQHPLLNKYVSVSLYLSTFASPLGVSVSFTPPVSLRRPPCRFQMLGVGARLETPLDLALRGGASVWARLSAVAPIKCLLLADGCREGNFAFFILIFLRW